MAKYHEELIAENLVDRELTGPRIYHAAGRKLREYKRLHLLGIMIMYSWYVGNKNVGCILCLLLQHKSEQQCIQHRRAFSLCMRVGDQVKLEVI